MNGTSLRQRLMILEMANAGQSDRQIAGYMHLSRVTVRKWRRKAQREGAEGLVSRMGRPARGAMSSFPAEVVETLRAWRQQHPGWGPLTLWTELGRAAEFQGKLLPSEPVITRWLKQEGLSRRYQKHTDLPASCVSPVQACHEEWEMDGRGQEYVPWVGVISLINLNDVFSRVKLLSYPCWLGAQRAERRPATPDYQLVLRHGFSEWGLPDRLAVDRDSVFFDNRNQSPFPTQLHLWLIGLGVDVTFGRAGQPRDQAVTERSHQTWFHQVLEGPPFANQQALWLALHQRRDFLNLQLPCRTLGDRPPLVAHPEARWPRRLYRPEQEGQLLQMERVYTYLSQGEWVRKVSAVGTFKLGQALYNLGVDWKAQEVRIRFEAEELQWVFHTPGKEKRLPLKGLTAQYLMGELGPLAHLQNFQLALPFTWDEWRQTQLCSLLSGTTLGWNR